MKKLLLIISALWLNACSGPELIPEAQMQAIITESLISEAVARNMVQKISFDERKLLDSVDFYAPVLSKYGYTIEDFGYTAAEMAIRKSNPLDNILTSVVEDIKKRNDMATYIYNQMKKFDTLVMNHYADTVYRKDTTIMGNFSKLKIPAIEDVQAGKYVVTFDYRVSSDMRLGAKTLRYRTYRGDKNVKVNSQFWMNRNNKDEKFKGEIEIDGYYEKLHFNFAENKTINKDAQAIKDSSTMSNIMIVFYPEITKARITFLDEILQKNKILTPDEKYQPKNLCTPPSRRERKTN